MADSIHYVSAAEREQYVEFLNDTIGRDNDPHLAHLFPLDTTNDDVYDAIAEGVLFPKMIARWFPDAINLNQLCLKQDKSVYEKNNNNDLALAAAEKIGIKLINIGGSDLTAKKETLVLGMTWQLIRQCLLAEIERTLDSTLDKTPPEEMLFKWFNYHLKNYGTTRTVNNWSSDLMDAECYCMLMNQIAGEQIGAVNVGKALREKDTTKRAQSVVEFAEKIKCRKFITARAINEGNPRLNLGFVATLYLAYPHMGPSADAIRAKQLEGELAEVRAALARAVREKEDVEQMAADERKAYENEIERLKARIRELEEEVEKLKRELAEERATNERLRKMLEEQERDHEEEMEAQRELMERKRRKAKELRNTYEELIMALRQEKEAALSQAQKELLDAMDRAQSEGKQTLVNVELENTRHLDRIRNMLTGATRQGWLKKQGRGMKKNSWKNRYFVLKDAVLCYYSSKADAENFKPLGVIHLEEARLYEVPEKERKFTFQLLTPKKPFAMQAKNAGEMKEWMNLIKLAKKRHTGIGVLGTKDGIVAGERGVTTTTTTITTISPPASPRDTIVPMLSLNASPSPLPSPGPSPSPSPRTATFGSRASMLVPNHSK
eukprot:TRINITY_DN4379_c0_g1_i1.p1 TRINITY_DN4379_c0_g1~~TRINITY_DN4379_c0_g1_i1.p1  ORF type:complete len:608 (+),score=144.41 TRINITY_DN4379_c0_g1_i1:155-1978(+)